MGALIGWLDGCQDLIQIEEDLSPLRIHYLVEQCHQGSGVVVRWHEDLVEFVDLELHKIEVILLTQQIGHLHQKLPVARPLAPSTLHLGLREHLLHAVVVFGLEAQGGGFGLLQDIFNCLDGSFQEVIVALTHKILIGCACTLPLSLAHSRENH